MANTPDATTLSDFLATARQAAERAGSVLVDGFGHARESAVQKAALTDIVTAVDKEAERVVVETIVSSYPDDAILGEEGSSRDGSTGRRWIIDPLDGTANYVRGWKMSAVSIGVEVDGVFTVGVVFNPLVDELFTAVRGGGAHLNDQPILISGPVVPFEGAYIGIDGGYMPWARQQRAHVAAHLIEQAGDFRQSGSTALSLCHVAMGRIDGHVNVGSSIWDVAAGTVIAREAGCKVEGVEPGSEPTSYQAVTARPELMEPLQSLVQSAVAHTPTGKSPGEE